MRGVPAPGCANLNAEDIAMTTRRELLQIGAGGPAGLAAEVGAGRLIVGTDFPYPWTMLGGNAMKLLGIRA